MGKDDELGGDIMTEKEWKYLTFSLDGEEYGISILKVKEIIGMMPVTTVPRTPDFVKRRHQSSGQGDSCRRSEA